MTRAHEDREGEGRGATREDGRLDFYEVDQAYIDDLKTVDPKIPNINYEVHRKFLCGILFDVGGLEYFAPISSFKRGQKTNFLIKNSKGRVVGCVRFSFMFPIVESARHIKDFSTENEARRNLLIEELRYCNRHARRIRSKARHVHDSAITGADPQIAAVCCDFKALEEHVRSRYHD